MAIAPPTSSSSSMAPDLTGILTGLSERLVHSSAPGQGSMDVGDWCGCGRAAAQTGVRPNPVVGVAPRADHDLGLLETGEDLSLQALVPEFPIRAVSSFTEPAVFGTG